MPQDKPKLSKVVYQLGWISFLADVSSELIYPILPVFLTATLGAPISAIGIIEGIAEAVVSLMKGWSGLASDVSGKRTPFMTFGYGLSALGKPIIALAGSWPVVLLARTFDRTGKGIRGPARDALMVEIVPKEDLGRATGIRHGMDTAGAFSGSLLALFLLSATAVPLRNFFLIAFIPGLLAALLTLRLPQSAPQSKPTTRIPWSDFSRVFWMAVAINALFAFANSSDMFPLTLGTKLGLGLPQVVMLYIGFNFVYTLACVPVGKASDKFDLIRLLGIGWLTYAAAYGLFAKVEVGSLIAGMGVYGISKAFTEVAGLVIVLKSLPENGKGQGIGLAMMIKGIAVLAGNAVMGAVWDKAGMQTAFALDAILCLVAVVALVPLSKLTSSRS